MTIEIAGLSEILGAFDFALVDQYGVLHDGRAPFAGAQHALRMLRDAGVPTVAVTNSGKRAEANLERLARLGFERALFEGLVCSGELAREAVNEQLRSGAIAQGAEIAAFARGGDVGALEGLAVNVAAPGSNTALLAILGVEPERIARERYRQQMAPLAQRGVPAICANPDLVMYDARGEASFGAGAVAADYEALGGVVRYLGKPARPIFERALEMLGGPAPDRVLMIGDSPEHDLAGAAALGCKTLFIAGGVQATLKTTVSAPDFTIQRLQWWRSA